MTREDFEAKLLEEARTWIGTPFLHYGRTKSQGVDCLGLLVCIYRNVGIDFHDESGNNTYSTSWFMHTKEEDYLKAILADTTLVDEPLVGDIMMFRPGRILYIPSKYITHAGMYLGGDEFIHTMSTSGAIISKRYYKAFAKMYVGTLRPLGIHRMLGENIEPRFLSPKPEDLM